MFGEYFVKFWGWYTTFAQTHAFQSTGWAWDLLMTSQTPVLRSVRIMASRHDGYAHGWTWSFARFKHLCLKPGSLEVCSKPNIFRGEERTPFASCLALVFPRVGSTIMADDDNVGALRWVWVANAHWCGILVKLFENRYAGSHPAWFLLLGSVWRWSCRSGRKHAMSKFS